VSTGPADGLNDRDDLADVAQLLAEAEAEADEQARAWDPADLDINECSDPEAAIRSLRAEPDREVGSPWRAES
jgi:hypothetical protein